MFHASVELVPRSESVGLKILQPEAIRSWDVRLGVGVRMLWLHERELQVFREVVYTVLEVVVACCANMPTDNECGIHTMQ